MIAARRSRIAFQFDVVNSQGMLGSNGCAGAIPAFFEANQPAARFEYRLDGALNSRRVIATARFLRTRAKGYGLHRGKNFRHCCSPLDKSRQLGRGTRSGSGAMAHERCSAMRTARVMLQTLVGSADGAAAATGAIAGVKST